MRCTLSRWTPRISASSACAGHPAAGVAEDLGVAWREAEHPERVDPGVHAGHHGDPGLGDAVEAAQRRTGRRRPRLAASRSSKSVRHDAQPTGSAGSVSASAPSPPWTWPARLQRTGSAAGLGARGAVSTAVSGDRRPSSGETVAEPACTRRRSWRTATSTASIRPCSPAARARRAPPTWAAGSQVGSAAVPRAGRSGRARRPRSTCRGRGRVQPAVQGPGGHQHRGRGEPVPGGVGDLPDLLRVLVGDRPGRAGAPSPRSTRSRVPLVQTSRWLRSLRDGARQAASYGVEVARPRGPPSPGRAGAGSSTAPFEQPGPARAPCARPARCRRRGPPGSSACRPGRRISAGRTPWAAARSSIATTHVGSGRWLWVNAWAPHGPFCSRATQPSAAGADSGELLAGRRRRRRCTGGRAHPAACHSDRWRRSRACRACRKAHSASSPGHDRADRGADEDRLELGQPGLLEQQRVLRALGR